MTTKTRLLIAVCILGLIDAIVPLFPILALVLIYVILEKPTWFADWVKEIYQTGQ